MKHVIIVLLCLGILTCICNAESQLDLTEEKSKISYGIGYQVGSDFKNQGFAINPQMLLQGVTDAIAGNEALMTHQEMSETLVDLQKKVALDQEEKLKAQAEKNLAEGKAFLAENGKKAGVTTLSSGLQYKIIARGTGKTPNPTDTVTVHYRGTLIDGTEFDSSYSRNKPETFRADKVIQGWKEALQMMKEGGKWELFVRSDLAYGNRRFGRIEPNSTLIFEVELISVNAE